MKIEGIHKRNEESPIEAAVHQRLAILFT